MAVVIERPSFFTSLPREYYHSEEIYELEVERVFHRQWLYFGHVSQVPEAGDFVAREVMGEGVIMMRGADGEVRAFLNVCRHRGARLCPLGAGRVRRIVCPYHQWTYGSDGGLVAAPTIPDGEGIDYEDWGLHPVQVEVWHGFVFVCLGVEPLEPLAPLFVSAEDAFARARTERVKEAHTVVYDVAANWKVVLENFSECYHCPATHPELCNVVDVFGYNKDHRVDDGWEYSTIQATLQPGAKTVSIDGEYVCAKLLGEFGEHPPPEGFNLGLYCRPVRTSVDLWPDYCAAFEIRPVSLDRTRMTQTWFVHEDAVEGVDYQIDSLIKVIDVTNRQDVELCELVQAGTRSRRYVPGPLSIDREPGVRFALTAYLNLMEQAD